jgi:hypothetical protein
MYSTKPRSSSADLPPWQVANGSLPFRGLVGTYQIVGGIAMAMGGSTCR